MLNTLASLRKTMFYDPKKFPNRIIIIDAEAGSIKINCLGCGEMVQRVYRANRFCRGCYSMCKRLMAQKWNSGGMRQEAGWQ